MLSKLNLLPPTVFHFAPEEDCFRRGITDGLRLESPAAINFDFNCCFVSESAKRNKK